MNTKLEAAARQALENAQSSFVAPEWTFVRNEDIATLREALAEQRPQNCGTGFCSCIECPYEQPAAEPVAWRWLYNGQPDSEKHFSMPGPDAEVISRASACEFPRTVQYLYTHSAPTQQPLTPREVELIDGMIEVQMHHAAQCDAIANRTMADKQKKWDMERVELLRKLKAAHTGSKA